MAENPTEVLERQVRDLTREVADLTRQIEHEQKMCGFLEDRVQRLESSVHSKMSRAEVIRWCWALIPLVVGAALLLTLVVAARPLAS
jgi:predicted RNase H-like nuclease (RuvC/YqgF family)